MSGIPLANLITALLPIIGGIIVGIVGLLFGLWLTRGQPDVFLIGVEPGVSAKTPKSQAIPIPEEVIEMSKTVKWSDITLDQTSNLDELDLLRLDAEAFIPKLEKALQDAQSFLKELNENSTDPAHRMSILKKLLDDDIMKGLFLLDLQRNEFPPFHVDKADSIPASMIEESKIKDYYIIIHYPFLNSKQRIHYGLVHDKTEKERLDWCMKMITQCAYEDLKDALAFIKQDLMNQCDHAIKIRDKAKRLIETTSWHATVMVANRGDRTVLLSPYALLTVKGEKSGHFEDIRLERLRLEDAEQKDVKLKGESRPPHDKDDKSTTQGKPNRRSDEYLFVQGQKPERFIFGTDDSDGSVDGKYEKLLSAYETGFLTCSIILKREGRLRWWSNPRLCSPEVCFGEEAKKSRKDEVAALAHIRFWDKVRLRFTGSQPQKTQY